MSQNQNQNQQNSTHSIRQNRHNLTHFPKCTSCVSCRECKQIRKPKIKNSATKISKNNSKLLYFDFAGPLITANNHEKYIAVLYSADGLFFCDALTDRTDTEFLDFFHTARQELDIEPFPFTIHCDREGLTRSILLNRYLAENGGKWQLGVSRRSNSNSVIENRVRLVSEAVATFLRSSGVPHKFWADAIRTFSVHWNSEHKSHDTLINKVDKSIPYGLLGHACLPQEMRGSKQSTRLHPRGTPVAFLGYDLQSSGGIWVAMRSGSGYKRLNIFERDVIWEDKYAFTITTANLKRIRKFEGDIIEGSSINDIDASTLSCGGEDDAILVNSDEDNDSINSDSDKSDVSSQISPPSPTIKTRSQRQKESSKSAQSQSIPKQNVKRKRHPKFIPKQKSPILNPTVIDTYTTNYNRIARACKSLFSKDFRRSIKGSKLRHKVMASWLSSTKVTKEDLEFAAEEALKQDRKKFDGKFKFEAMALIVSTRRALRDGAPSGTEAEKFEWRGSVKDEVGGLIAEGVLRPCKISEVGPNDELLPSILILAVKSDGRHKARLVAAGNHSKFDTRATTYSSVVGRESWLPIMITMLKQGYSLTQIDVSQAFLQTDKADDDPDRPRTFLRGTFGLPDGDPENPDCQDVYEVLKSIYGLKSASAAWKTTLVKFLRTKGWRASRYDDSIYVKNDMVLLLYVDDLLYLGPDKAIRQEISDLKRRFRCQEEQTLSEDQDLLFLGHKLSLSKIEDGKRRFEICQQDYIEEAAKKLNVEAASKPKLNPDLFDTEYLAQGKPLSSKGQTELRSFIGTMSYAATGTRADVLSATSILAEGQSSGTERHLEGAKHLLRFMVTQPRKLSYVVPIVDSPVMPSSFELDAYFDSNYALRSRTGLILYINGAPVLFKSKKQATTSLSTAEAELVAATLAGREVMGLRNLLQDVFGSDRFSLNMYGDNLASVLIANQQANVRKVRHLSIDRLYIRELTENHNLLVHWVPTDRNPSDFLTKILGHIKLKQLWEAAFDEDLRGARLN